VSSRREQWERSESKHCEEPSHRKEGETDHSHCKNSPRKRRNGGTPVGYLGWIALRKGNVHCITIAGQRLGKHIPAGLNTHDNRTSIASQRWGKHASSTIQAPFCVVHAKAL
jgi:hypothetical protein